MQRGDDHDPYRNSPTSTYASAASPCQSRGVGKVLRASAFRLGHAWFAARRVVCRHNPGNQYARTPDSVHGSGGERVPSREVVRSWPC